MSAGALAGSTSSTSTKRVAAGGEGCNGDGQVDDRDDPDVLIVSAAGSVTALDAAAVEKWTATGTDGESSVVVGDVDADGWLLLAKPPPCRDQPSCAGPLVSAKIQRDGFQRKHPITC